MVWYMRYGAWDTDSRQSMWDVEHGIVWYVGYGHDKEGFFTVREGVYMSTRVLRHFSPGVFFFS